jgi:hypothetical protein
MRAYLVCQEGMRRFIGACTAPPAVETGDAHTPPIGNMHLNELGWLRTLPGSLNDVWVLKKLWSAVEAVLSAVIWWPIC